MELTRNLGNRIIKYSTALSLAAMLAACGGGGSGGGGGTPLASGTFIKTVEGNGQSWGSLFGTNTANRYMYLHRASDIGGSGNIAALRLQLDSNEAEAISCPNTTIRLGHTSVTDLETTFANNVEQGKGAMVTVVDNATVTIPTGAIGDFFEIPLSTPFHYNGIDNLVIEIARSAACSNPATVLSQSPAGYIGVVYHTTSNVAITGTIFDTRLSAKFVFSGGDNFVNPDVGGTASNNVFPFNTNVTNGRKVQLLHLAAEMDGSGPITGIGFPVGTSPASAQIYTVSIKLGHSTLSELATGPFAASYSDTPVTVAEDLEFQVPAGLTAGEIIWLPVTGTFNYNGVDNLIVEIETTDNSQATDGTTWSFRNETTSWRRMYGALGSVDGTAHDSYYPTEFRFHGSTIDRVIGVGGYETYMFPSAGRSGQYLYLASELGTSGTITRLACRLASDVSTETLYPNYQIVMSHTDATTLGTDMAANVPNPVVVYSGSYTVPAGLIKGDWIEVPLTSGFNYNGTQNLVIQSKSDAGSVEHNCSVLSDATRYPARRTTGTTPDAATGSVMDHLRDVRLGISK